MTFPHPNSDTLLRKGFRLQHVVWGFGITYSLTLLFYAREWYLYHMNKQYCRQLEDGLRWVSQDTGSRLKVIVLLWLSKLLLVSWTTDTEYVPPANPQGRLKHISLNHLLGSACSSRAACKTTLHWEANHSNLPPISYKNSSLRFFVKVWDEQFNSEVYLTISICNSISGQLSWEKN